jgi:NitT/TauT family transport system substrate-binding protein
MAASGPPVAPAFGAPEPEFASRAEKFSVAAQGNGKPSPHSPRAAPPLARQERTMRLISARHAALAVAAALGVLATAMPGPAAAETRLKLVLNWKYQGPQGWFMLAEDRGYFKAEGLDIVIDQGDGSAAAVPKVASGAYDVGFGDINALIEFAAKNPVDAPIGVYMMYNRPPFTIAVKADSPIKTPKDFEGRTLGGAANDGALKLFPAFAKVAKFDAAKVAITNMAPNLREQMLMRGQVDGVFGYVNTIRFSARLIGVKDSDIRFINYGDYGMDLYSNAIIVSKKLVKEHPEVVAGLVRAINKGLIDALKDPDAAVAAVAQREPLINVKIERERFDATLKDEMNHPETATLGLGDIDDARLKKSIDILVDANGLARTPALGEIFTHAFLPPKADRPMKLF